MRFVTVLLRWRDRPVLGLVAVEILRLYGADIPRAVVLGQDVQIHHRGLGVVLHPRTTVGDRVHIFQGVTVGKADPTDESFAFPGAEIGDDVVLGSGCKVLGGRDGIAVGRGTMVGANAVLTCSTGEWEVWAGVPARRLGQRRQSANERVADAGSGAGAHTSQIRVCDTVMDMGPKPE